jgi:hypothetical protein
MVLVLAALLVLLLALWVLARRAPRRPAAEGIEPSVQLRLTRHVRERMEQRDVTLRAVERTLREPHARTFDATENSWKFERVFDGESVKVWVNADPWPPRGDVVVKSTAAQRFAHLRVPRAAVGRVIGRGGSVIGTMRRETGARIDVGKDGLVTITADTRRQVEHAASLVRRVARG